MPHTLTYFSRLLGSLRYPSKFALLASLFLVPLVITSYFFLREINGQIRFAQDERKGVAYMPPVMRLLQESSRRDHAIQSMAERPQAKVERMNQLIGEVDLVHARANLGRNVETAWAQIKAEWREAREVTDEAKALEHQERLTRSILALVVEIGKNSNLILDPDVDTYYLMDTTVLSNPAIVTALGHARFLDAKADAASDLGPSLQFAKHIGEIELLKDRLKNSYEQYSQHNPSLVAATQKNHSALQESLREVIDHIQTHAAKTGLTETRAKFVADLDRTERALDAYQTTALSQLDRLLAVRIESFVFRRNSVITITSLSLAAVALVMFGFYRSTVSSVRETVRAASAMALGDFQTVARIESRDELGDLNADLQIMGQGLQRIASMADRIAEGDLSARIPSLSENDALSESLNRMLSNLRSLVRDLVVSAGLVAEEAVSLSEANDSVRETSRELDASMEQVLGCLSEVSIAATGTAALCLRQTERSRSVSTIMASMDEEFLSAAGSAREQEGLLADLASASANLKLAQSVAACNDATLRSHLQEAQAHFGQLSKTYVDLAANQSAQVSYAGRLRSLAAQLQVQGADPAWIGELTATAQALADTTREQHAMLIRTSCTSEVQSARLQDVVLRTASEADAAARYQQIIIEIQRLTGELQSQVTPYLVRLQEVAEANALSRTEIERLAESAEQQLTQVQTLAASTEEVVRLAGTFQSSLGTQLTAIDTLNQGVREVAHLSETMDTAADKFCFNRRENDDVSLDDFVANAA